MKPFYMLGIAMLAALCVTAQPEWGANYSLSLPQHEMKENIKPLHSLNLVANFDVKKIKNLSWGIEAGFGQYAFFTKDQDIRFPDGSGITTKVSYSSNVATVGLLTRYAFLNNTKVNPYVTGKVGYANFFSKVFVFDPEDEDDCKPLDKKTPIADNSFFAAYGGGLLIDISGKKNSKNTWLDFSVTQLHGTKLDYINIKDIKDHVHNDPNNPTPGKSEPLSIRFVNVATQTIHEHQLAEVYNSPLRMLSFKLGVLWRVN